MISFFKGLDKKQKFILIGITIISIVFRLIWLNARTGDYNDFLLPWINNIKELGYFESLKYNIGDYNVPYIIILVIISMFKIEPLFLIKFVSIIFDYVCAIYSLKIVYKLTNKNILLSLIAYASVLFLPTVMLNGAMWGQCDSIYTSFILISLYYLLDKKYTKSFIFFGIAFAFKLQSVFILPLYILMLFREKEIKIYHFLLIPLVNIIMCLPSILMGRDIVEVMLIYFNQTGVYDTLVMNFVNLYNFFIKDLNFYFKYYELITIIGICFTIFIYFCMWLYVLLKKVRFNSEKIITVGIWSVMIATFFLPRMHDRYMFVIDILSVIWLIIYQKKIYIPFVINIMSIIMYIGYLFSFKIVDYRILSVVYFIFIFIFTLHTLKILSLDNDVKVLKKYKNKKIEKNKKC